MKESSGGGAAAISDGLTATGSPIRNLQDNIVKIQETCETGDVSI
jgi:hypothetical protein